MSEHHEHLLGEQRRTMAFLAKLAMNETERLTAALERIRDECGATCVDYAMCEHGSCASSAQAWQLADAALRGKHAP
jgi:hypothetical protein